MRIAIFSWESMHSICVGGVGVHVTELAASLERKGNEVHVFTRLGKHDHARYECIYGVHYHRCPFSDSPDFVEAINNMCRSFVDAFFQTENVTGPFDVIHSHDWLTSNAMVWIKHVRPSKAVLTIHSTEYGRCGNDFHNGNSARIRDHERHGTYCADHVIAVSKALKGEIQWMYNTPDWKVDVVYNGVNCNNFNGFIDPGAVRRHYGIGPMDPMVLFVGRIVYQKGPDLLIEAMPHILKHYNNAKFVFVGDGEMRWGVEDRAKQIGVHHATRFIGFNNGWKLSDLYKATDVVCMPSRNEPFGIVLLEAWSAGKPVIATSNGGPGEIIWHDITGLKVYANPESIAWGIGTAFSDFDHARWMGANGRIAVETAFSWDVVADQVIDVYSR